MIRYEIEAEDHSSLIDRIRRDFAGLLNTRPYALATSDSLDAIAGDVDGALKASGLAGDAGHFDHINEPELPGMNPDQPKRKRRTKAEMEAARMAQADGPKAEAVAAATAEVSAGQAAVPDNTASVPAAPLLAAEGASAQAAVLGNDAGAAAPITAQLTPDEFRAKIQVWASEGGGRLPLVTGALAKLGVQKVKEVSPADYGSFLAELGVK